MSGICLSDIGIFKLFCVFQYILRIVSAHPFLLDTGVKHRYFKENEDSEQLRPKETKGSLRPFQFNESILYFSCMISLKCSYLSMKWFSKHTWICNW